MSAAKNLTPVESPKGDFVEIELRDDLRTPSLKDRKGQVVRVFRADGLFQIMEHPAGVEIVGKAAWTGVVPWSSIKAALRTK